MQLHSSLEPLQSHPKVNTGADVWNPFVPLMAIDTKSADDSRLIFTILLVYFSLLGNWCEVCASAAGWTTKLSKQSKWFIYLWSKFSSSSRSVESTALTAAATVTQVERTNGSLILPRAGDTQKNVRHTTTLNMDGGIEWQKIGFHRNQESFGEELPLLNLR